MKEIEEVGGGPTECHKCRNQRNPRELKQLAFRVKRVLEFQDRNVKREGGHVNDNKRDLKPERGRHYRW